MTDKNAIYAECKDVVTFNKNMTRFFNFVMEISEISHLHKSIKRGYKFYANEDRKDYIIKLLGIMEPHIILISQYDEGIFSNDYTTSSMKLIPGIDFKQIFGILPGQYKKQMFTHLQTIYISAEMAKGQLCKATTVLKKQKEFIFNMIKNLGMDEVITKKIAEFEKEEADSEKSWFDFSKLSELKDIFGEDNPIVKLAREIMAEVNMDHMTADKISENFAEKIQKIIKLFLATIQRKFASGEISMKSLMADITDIITKVGTVFPAVKEFINPEMLHEMFFAKKKKEGGEGKEYDSDDTESDCDEEINFEDISNNISAGMETLMSKLKESGIDLNNKDSNEALLNKIKAALPTSSEDLDLNPSELLEKLKELVPAELMEKLMAETSCGDNGINSSELIEKLKGFLQEGSGTPNKLFDGIKGLISKFMK